MKNCLMIKKHRETLISGVISLLLMTGLLALLIITGYLFRTNKDERIESAAKDSLASKTYLKGDDIQIYSEDGVVTLIGTVAEKPHLVLAADAVADLPEVKSVHNRLEVRGHSAISGPAPRNPSK